MNTEKIYIVTSAGTSKTGKPYSRLSAVVKLKNSEFISDKDFIMLDIIKPVGTKMRAKTTLE